MAEKAPELHVKALLAAGADVGTAVDAVHQRAQQLSNTPASAAPVPANATAPPSPK